MSTEPEALRLADALERMSLSTKWDKQAAKELRRLHAANIDCIDHFNAVKAERDELLWALEFLVAGIEGGVSETYIPLVKARAAIAKANGEQV